MAPARRRAQGRRWEWRSKGAGANWRAVTARFHRYRLEENCRFVLEVAKVELVLSEKNFVVEHLAERHLQFRKNLNYQNHTEIDLYS